MFCYADKQCCLAGNRNGGNYGNVRNDKFNVCLTLLVGFIICNDCHSRLYCIYTFMGVSIELVRFKVGMGKLWSGAHVWPVKLCNPARKKLY